jgi:hypothetical protein
MRYCRVWMREGVSWCPQVQPDLGMLIDLLDQPTNDSEPSSQTQRLSRPFLYLNIDHLSPWPYWNNHR